MRQQPLLADDVADALKTLHDWEYKDTWLRKTFNFNTFTDAVQFVNRVAELSERVNHHPDIYLRHKTVVLILQTHAASHQVTHFDVELARQIEALLPAKTDHAL